MAKKVCDVKDHPELKLVVDEMEKTKNDLVARAEYYKAQVLAAQKEMNNIKDEAVFSSKKHWDLITNYLEKNSLLTEPIDTDKGETLSFSKDGGTLEIKSAAETMLVMMQMIVEAQEGENKSSSESSMLDFKVPSKEFLN